MRKKSSIILFVFLAILFISTFSFSASNDVKNAINKETNMIVDGANKLGSDMRNGVMDAENKIDDAVMMNNTDMDTRMPNDYVATRASDTMATSNTQDATNVWIWIVLAVAIAVIVGLVWYYVAQDNH